MQRITTLQTTYAWEKRELETQDILFSSAPGFVSTGNIHATTTVHVNSSSCLQAEGASCSDVSAFSASHVFQLPQRRRSSIQHRHAVSNPIDLTLARNQAAPHRITRLHTATHPHDLAHLKIIRSTSFRPSEKLDGLLLNAQEKVVNKLKPIVTSFGTIRWDVVDVSCSENETSSSYSNSSEDRIDASTHSDNHSSEFVPNIYPEMSVTSPRYSWMFIPAATERKVRWWHH